RRTCWLSRNGGSMAIDKYPRLKAMVLAAGAGTRLRPLTYETPKPMVPILNRPVVHHVLDNLVRHGVNDVVMNLYSQPEQLRGYCGNGAQWALNIHYSHEKRLMGTAGAIKRVEPLLSGGPFVVMSGDGLSDVDITALYAFHRQKRSMATMAVKAVDSRFDYGVTLADGAGRITGFLEKPSWGDVFSNKVNTGIYLFEPEVFRYIPAGRSYDFGKDLWPKLLKLKKRIFAWEWKGYWCDVGNLSEYRRAQMDGLDGKVGVNIPGRQVRKGVWIDDACKIHPDAKLVAPCVIGKGSVIEGGAVIGPYTVVGERSRISPKAVLKNCILFRNVFVARNVHLSNCVIGDDGHIDEDITVYDAAVLNVRQ
ncbi:MAG: NDP-sugar synthase, partial [Elusimicrobia bacterium]|nr:NDP-sugar synthase [Elusimicrobiota bacterium]